MAIMIADNLRLLRRSRKYTLEEVADIVGVSRQSVSKWETGETYPDIENCLKLAVLYKVSLDALVKEPLQAITEKANKMGQYVFGVVEVSENGEIPLPEKAKSMFEISPGEQLLLLGDKKQGIAVVKCSGVYDFLDMEEEK